MLARLHLGLRPGGGDLGRSGVSRPSPIPKFDETGKQVGVYAPEDVPHRSTFGLPAEDTSKLPGYDPRNAPFGGAWVMGQEHLSARKDAHLRYLAARAGLSYQVLSETAALIEAIAAKSVYQTALVSFELWPALAALALVALLGGYLWQRKS